MESFQEAQIKLPRYYDLGFYFYRNGAVSLKFYLISHYSHILSQWETERILF